MTFSDGSSSSPFHPKVFITGHNASHQAIVQESYECPEKVFLEHAFTNHHLYKTSKVPVDMNDDADIKDYKEWASSEKVGITVQNGTVCRYVNLAPGHQPLSHRTQSLDFGIVTDGEVMMELDDGSKTHLRKGDIVIQRGTMHAWSNPSQTEWARMVFFLQDSLPVRGIEEDLGKRDGLAQLFTQTYDQGK